MSSSWNLDEIPSKNNDKITCSILDPFAKEFFPQEKRLRSMDLVGFNPLNNPALGLSSTSDRTSMEIVLPNTPRNGLNPCAKYFSQKYSNLPGDRNLLNPLAKNFKPNLNPLAPIFIPSTEVLDRNSQGIHKFQQHRNVSESEDVLDITPTAFDSETPNLSLSEETYCSNSTAYTFINFNELGAYTFIYMISVIVIGVLHTLRTKSVQPDSTFGVSGPFLLGGSEVTEDAAHTGDNDTDTLSVISINDKDNDDPKKLLQTLKAKNSERPIVAHLNINFLNPKFEPLKDIIKDNGVRN